MKEVTQTVYAMIPTGKITQSGHVYFDGDKIGIRYNEWKQIKFSINLN
jgi:hypothetical protein